MAKLLNLDELAPTEDRVLKLRGKEHVMKALSVADVIENSRAAKKLEKNPDIADEFELLIKMIGRSFPTLTEEELGDLSIEHLRAIMEFVQQGDSEENPPAPAKG